MEQIDRVVPSIAIQRVQDIKSFLLLPLRKIAQVACFPKGIYKKEKAKDWISSCRNRNKTRGYRQYKSKKLKIKEIRLCIS